MEEQAKLRLEELEVGKILFFSIPAVNRDRLDFYLGAVRDPALEGSFENVPPLGALAFAFGELFKQVEFPVGSLIHREQTLDNFSLVPLEENIQVEVHVDRNRVLGGARHINLQFFLKVEDSVCVRALTKLMIVDSSVAGSSEIKIPATTLENFEIGSRTIYQSDIEYYAEASLDFNPVHLDAEFAKGTMFRGVIAHGMMVLAGITNALRDDFSSEWETNGTLDVAFVSPVRPGDTVSTAIKDLGGGHFEVGCFNQKQEQVIRGKASLTTGQTS